MENFENLVKISKSISEKVLDSIILTETLDEILDGERKECLLTSLINKNLRSVFEEIEKCRKMIGIYN